MRLQFEHGTWMALKGQRIYCDKYVDLRCLDRPWIDAGFLNDSRVSISSLCVCPESLNYRDTMTKHSSLIDLPVNSETLQLRFKKRKFDRVLGIVEKFNVKSMVEPGSFSCRWLIFNYV